MAQEYKNQNQPTDSAAEAEYAVSSAASEQKQLSDVDDILDDIDAILENNAESFVQGFVQKGGQ